MAIYCKCDNFYDIEDFRVGSKVKFRELPVSLMKRLKLIIDEDFTIKSFKVRVNSLGELAVLAELDQLPGVYFSVNVLKVKNTSSTPIDIIKDNTFDSLIEDNLNLMTENSKLKSLVKSSFNYKSK